MSKQKCRGAKAVQKKEHVPKIFGERPKPTWDSRVVVFLIIIPKSF